ncbi:MAG: hypothetical protein WAM79_20080 [Candidatus Sulfotelmatobacter sp.]
MNTSSRTPTELVDRYLQAVRFWLPKNHRQGDLLAELGEDLRSQIDAKEEALGHSLDQSEVSEILKRCGNPMVVASRMGPQRHLIGPTLFPVYLFVLKMVLLWILVPVFIFIVAPVNLANTNGNWPAAILNTIGGLWSGAFIAAGTITLVFAILERSKALAHQECKWDPAKLPPLEKTERKTSLVQTVCELGFQVFALVWLLLLPQHPFLILGPAAGFLKTTPLVHTFYLPIMLLWMLSVARSASILAKPEWTWLPMASQLIQSASTLIVLNFLLHAVTQTPKAEWFPFLILTDAARNSVHYIKIAAVVNVSILISAVGAWIGLCIATIVQTWQLLRHIRKQGSVAHPAISAQAR